MEEFVSLGEWWLPNNPEVVVAGKLSFSPNSGAKLELIGSFYNWPFQDTGKVKDLSLENNNLLSEDSRITQENITFDYIKPEETIILGRLQNNEEITLYKCSGSMSSVGLVEIEKANFLFKATYIFRKIHFKTEQNIKFNSISVRYPNLEEWIGKSGIQVMWSREENRIWISYQPPSSIPIAEFKGLDMSVTFLPIYINPLDIYFGATYYKANVEQKTFLTLNNPQKQSIDKCFETIVSFRDFLTLGMSNPSSVSAVMGNVDITSEKSILKEDGSYSFEEVTLESKVNILFAFGDSGKNSETKVFLHEMLFIYNDIEGNLGEVFKQWLHKKETYESVFGLFMITMYTSDLYLHYHFLNIIQALEVYHRIKYKKKEAYLKTRLREILKDITHLLPDNFIGGANDRESFIERAVITRNALTHHSKKEKAAKSEELAQLFYTLKVILQSCLLQELSFTNESINKLIERNRNSLKEWRLPN